MALHLVVIALIQELSRKGILTGPDVVARLDALVAGLPDPAVMDHSMHETLALIRSNLEML